MKPGQIVAYVDAAGFIHDAEIISVISDGKAPFNALTLRTLDDGVERSNVQHAEERPANTDARVVNGHISAGHWRLASEAETKDFAGHAKRRAETRRALAEVDETPEKDETPEETRVRVAEAKTAIIIDAPEPALPFDEEPWAGETPGQTEQRLTAQKAAQKAAKKG